MSIIDRVKELQEKTIDLYNKEEDEDIRNTHKAKLSILLSIGVNGYVDSVLNRFIELWNQDCELERPGWFKEDKI